MKNYIQLYLLTVSMMLWHAGSAQSFDDVSILSTNNIAAASGVHGGFWHVKNGSQTKSGLEFPKGTGKRLGFSMSLWMAGYDANQQLRAAATSYRANGQEYWPGPISASGGSISYQESEKWARVWQLRRSEVDSFLAISNHTLANTSSNILEWPAKGNPHAKGRNGVALTVLEAMAPFVDVNSDGNYDPLSGDYPVIKGDEMQWVVFNDNGPVPHNELSFGSALGAEVKGLIYGYKSRPSLLNILFYEFDIVSKQRSLDSFSVGVFADFDLGNANNDYLGFDSVRNLAYFYNASIIDGNAQAHEYGDSIPTVGLRFLEFEGSNCVTRSALGSFMYVSDQSGTPHGMPTNSSQVYQFLRHTWRDSTPLRGHSATTWGVHSEGHGGNGTLKQFVYDNSIIGSASLQWNECAMQHAGADRKMIAGMPVTKLQLGQHYKLSFALVASERKLNNGCPMLDFSVLNALSDSAAHYFCNPLLSTEVLYGNKFTDFTIFPNPVSETLFITTNSPAPISASFAVRDLLGRSIPAAIINQQNGFKVDLRGYPKGVYVVEFITDYGRSTKKFVKQ